MTEPKLHFVGKDKVPCQCAWCAREQADPVVMSDHTWNRDGDGRDVEAI